MATTELLSQPTKPTASVVVIEVRGGTDKGADGHRRDTVPICNALIKLGMHAEPIFYSDAEWASVYSKATAADCIVVRVNPGKYDGVTQSELERLIIGASNRGVLAMSHPEVMKRMGAKDALVKIRDLDCGATDTYAYYNVPSFIEVFPKTVAAGTRVLKQNRGSQGEGIWVCSVAPGQSGPVGLTTLLDLQEAVDNHKEQRTLADFMAFCEQYIEGEDGQLIDQPFLPRIAEGEVRVNMIYDKPTEVVHKKPKPGGISATLASGAAYTTYKPDAPEFAPLMERFLHHDLPHIMPALGMDNQPLPLIWTADFILGPKDAQGKDTYIVGEFNCSCVGITQQLHLADPVAAAAVNIIRSVQVALKPQAARPVIPTQLPPIAARIAADAAATSTEAKVHVEVNSAAGLFGATGLLGPGQKSAQVKHYLEETKVMDVLRKGLKRLYRSQPSNPIRFLANFLLEHDPQAYDSPIVQAGLQL